MKVLWSSTRTDPPPSFKMAPADPNMVPAARFSVKVLSVTSRLAPKTFAMAPPWAMGPTAWLLSMVTWERTTRAPVLSRPPPRVTGPMGPTTVASVARPLAMVRSRISTSVALPLTLKTRLASLPLMVKRLTPGPSMDQVVRDAQLAAGQGDGAVTSRGGEADQVGAGVVVGVEDRLPQRPGAAVGEVPDREGAGDGPVLQRFDAQAGSMGPLRSRVGRCPCSPGRKRGRAGRTPGRRSMWKLF